MTASQTLVLAVQELERLLGHLRTCEPCYTNEPCLDRHFLIKDVQNKTEEARRIARQTSTFADGTPYIVGVHGPAPRPRPPSAQRCMTACPPCQHGAHDQCVFPNCHDD